MVLKQFTTIMQFDEMLADRAEMQVTINNLRKMVGEMNVSLESTLLLLARMKLSPERRSNRKRQRRRFIHGRPNLESSRNSSLWEKVSEMGLSGYSRLKRPDAQS